MKSRKNRAQSAIEFMIITGGILFFIVGFMVAVEINKSAEIGKKRDSYMNDAALAIKDEVDIASSASDGYSREFRISGNAYGMNFNASIKEDFVYLYSLDGKHALAYPISNTTGDLKIGPNIIEKINGVVYLNRV